MPSAVQASSAASRSPSACDAPGWLLVRAGELQDGLTLLEQAHVAAPTDPMFGYHYAFALARTGESDRASALLHPLLSGTVDCTCRAAVQRLLAELDRS